MSVGTPDLNACGILDDAAHAAMLFSASGIAILRKAALQVFRLPDVDQLFFVVVDKVNAGQAGNRIQELHSKFAVEISDGHG
jgi:hypothetical protein